VVVFGADFGDHFGRLEEVPRHLKCLSLVVYYSWDYVGHIATGLKWLTFQLIYLNFGGTVNYPHDHTHQV